MQSTRLNKLLEFLKSEPDDAFVMYALATEYNAQGDKEKAFGYYLELLEKHPSYLGTYYHLGKLYEKEKQTEKAIEIYKIGLQESRKKGDNHAFSELQGACNSAMGLDYEDD